MQGATASFDLSQQGGIMRLILVLIVGFFLGTYGWGWFIHVHQGRMDTKSYTEYYGREVNDQVHRFFEKSGKMADAVMKPLPARKDFAF